MSKKMRASASSRDFQKDTTATSRDRAPIRALAEARIAGQPDHQVVHPHPIALID
jgi:hypothetical protein